MAKELYVGFYSTSNDAVAGRRPNSQKYETVKSYIKDLFSGGHYRFVRERLKTIANKFENEEEINIKKLSDQDVKFFEEFCKKATFIAEADIKWAKISLEGFLEEFTAKELAGIKKAAAKSAFTKMIK